MPPLLPKATNGLPRKLPKLSDVARLANVGNGTVSRVLNGGKNVSKETAARVEAVIQQLDYKPNRAARRLKGAASGIIGMIVPSISDMFFSRCAEAVEEVVRANGGMLIVTASNDSPRGVLESFQQLMLHQMDGLILVQSFLQETALLEELEGVTIPVIGIDRPLLNTRFPSVGCENYVGARAGTQHLLDHGYETILHVQVKSKLYTMRERLRGYRAAMKGSGRMPCSRDIHDVRGARLAIEQAIAGAKRPLGIFAGNNLTARYLLEAAIELHLHIPTDIAMLSFDDFDLADALNPPMSVVQQPVDEIGRHAAMLLFQPTDESSLRSERTPPVMTMLPTRLILRGSCGCRTRSES